MSLYGICIDYPAQGKLAERYCHGDLCGKGIFAFLPSPAGTLLPCRQDSCPIQDDLSDELKLQTGGEKVILRKLKEPIEVKEDK